MTPKFKLQWGDPDKTEIDILKIKHFEDVHQIGIPRTEVQPTSCGFWFLGFLFQQQ